MSVAFEYVGDDEREIPDARLTVNPGEVFEVDEELAKGLEGQPSLYKRAKAKPAAKTAKEGDE